MLPDIVFFEGRDATNATSLWETNGTQSGTFVVSNVASPPPLITREPKYGFVPGTASLDLTVFKSQVLFAGGFSPTITPVSIGPYTIWTSDGTANGTVPLIIPGANSKGLFFFDGPHPNNSIGPGFTVFGDQVLFRGVDTAGAAGLWMTDGTAAGTTEITAGAASTGINPTDITVYGGVALFNGVNAAGDLGLWKTDGTSGGTQELTPIADAAATGLDPTDMTVFNHEVLFNGANAAGDRGLWMTNGTSGGTQEITSIDGAAAAGLDPTDLTVFGSEVLFSGVDADGLYGLWITDGSASGTHELLAEATGAIAAKDPLGLNPKDVTLFNGEAFFSGRDKFGRQQLWETDGTVAGTQMLTVAAASTSFGLTPSSLEVYDGQLLFQGSNSKGYFGLWTSDGTAAGTQEITPSSGTYLYGFTPTDLTALTPGSSPSTVTSSILWQNTSTGQASIWDMNGSTQVGGGAVSANPGPSWTEIGAGDFNKDGHSDILWQNASSGQASIWEMNGNSLIGGGPVTPTPGPSFRAVGTGDFTGDGFADDILWQNTSTGQASIWEMDGNSLDGGGPVTSQSGACLESDRNRRLQ